MCGYIHGGTVSPGNVSAIHTHSQALLPPCVKRLTADLTPGLPFALFLRGLLRGEPVNLTCRFSCSLGPDL